MTSDLDQPLFIHSGIRRSLDAAQAFGVTKNDDPKETLYDFFAGFAGGSTDRLIFPAFNYDFGRTRRFNVDDDPVQVGSFPEFIRTSKPFVRSAVPFFSFLSSHDLKLDMDGVINPFGKMSGFQRLFDLDSTLMFAGAELASITIIHYIEEMSGGPLYRYEKAFPGTIVQGANERACELIMHVRPMGVHMDYDWPRLFAELQKEGILRFSDHSDDIFFIGVRQLREFWGNKVSDNPLYLLDEQSLTHFKSATNDGSRRVSIEEYEDV